MAASDALRPAQFFHGTQYEGANLQPGDYILPGSLVGRQNWTLSTDTHERSQHMFLTKNDEAEAWGWAVHHSGFHPEHHPVVYEVEPVGSLQPDDYVRGAYMAPRARVKRRLTVPHPDAYGSPVQAKLPGITDEHFQSPEEYRNFDSEATGKATMQASRKKLFSREIAGQQSFF